MAKNIKRESTEKNTKPSSNQYFNLDAEKAFFDEVDEEVRNERFKELMNKYGVYRHSREGILSGFKSE